MPSPVELRVLLAVRVLGFADTDRVAERAAADPDRVDEVLAGAVTAGWIQRREGRVAGWSLTAAGRRRGEDLLAAEREERGVGEELADRYRAFLPLNARLLDVCTRWQVRPGPGGTEVPNAHDDPDHDRQVLSDLDALHVDAGPLLDALAAALDRFAAYRVRLDHAHDRVRAGDEDWFTRPLVDSYHTVWFELHEDLLATLGRDRGSEATGRGGS